MIPGEPILPCLPSGPILPRSPCWPIGPILPGSPE